MHLLIEKIAKFRTYRQRGFGYAEEVKGAWQEIAILFLVMDKFGISFINTFLLAVVLYLGYNVVSFFLGYFDMNHWKIWEQE